MHFGQLAQLVEQGIENPCVLGSIPRLATTHQKPRLGGVFRFRASVRIPYGGFSVQYRQGLHHIDAVVAMV